MRVLHIISETPPIRSGFARCIYYLSKGLSNLGCEVETLSVKDLRHSMAGEVKLVFGIEKIISKIYSKEYDVINIHGHTPSFSDLAFIVGKVSRIPIVYTLHCLVNFYFYRISNLYNLFLNQLLQFSDAVIVSSESYLKFIKNCKNKFVIPWAVDTELFKGKRKDHDGYNILFVGQMRSYKGQKILLEAIKGMNVKLNLIGNGPDLGYYEQYSKMLNLNNVTFLGNVSDDKLKSLYSSSDVLVLPSVSKNEAFGLVTLEAAACGCAVIASDLPGVRDVVKDFGKLVEPGNVESLREALETFRDPSIRGAHVLKGKNMITHYKWENVAKKYLDVYQNVIRSKKI